MELINEIEQCIEEKVVKKRGRKPSETKKNNYYFGQEEEEAFLTYVSLENAEKKDMIFRKKLYPAFSKMVESIIRTYSLFVPLEEFDETFSDAMSFLMTKIDNFDPKSGKLSMVYHIKGDKVNVNGTEYIIEDGKVIVDDVKDETDEDTIDKVKYDIKGNKLILSYPVEKNRVKVNGVEYIVEDEKVTIDGAQYKVEYYKLFSYCGTICKRYLIHRRNQDKKRRDKQLSYDYMFPTADKDTRIDVDDERYNIKFNNDLINCILFEIDKMLNKDNISLLNDNEQKIGYALREILSNWEEIFFRLGNKKFNKTSLWFFLKERTLLNSKEIRDGMKKFKNLYFLTKEKMITE